MDWSDSTTWWVLAGVLVAAELATGSFYLLMFALGAAAGAVAAHLGLSSAMQIAAAALVGGGATAVWHYRRARAPRSPPPGSNRDVNLDVGQALRVEQWGVDGTARVQYRGAAWSVRYVGSGQPQPGEHVIVALDGNQLRVAPAVAR